MLRHGRPRLRVGGVLALAALQVTGSVGAASRQHGHHGIDVVAVLLLVAGPLSLLALNRFPWVALGVPLAAATTWFALDYPPGPIPAAFAIALVVSTAVGRRRQAWTVAGVAFAIVWTGLLIDVGANLGGALGGTAWLIVFVTLGEQVRTRHEKAHEADLARTEQEQRRAGEERLRVARELHDVLAHNISLISVQAGVALHLMDTHPEQVRTALTTIRDASRDTLHELRATVGALRQEGEAAPLRPTPGMASLEALTAGVGAAGVQVRTTVTGDRRALPAGVDLAAYRIVQEALTNVARHAATSQAEVHVDYGDEMLSVRVVDEGAGAGHVRAGNGLTGMRERAAALGGRLTAGPRPQGGFAVEALLPLEGT